MEIRRASGIHIFIYIGKAMPRLVIAITLHVDRHNKLRSCCNRNTQILNCHKITGNAGIF